MILLCFVLVITCVLVTKGVKDGYTSYADEDTFYYAIKAENFSYVVDSYHRNVVSSNGDKKSLLEYYGVAKYFEAAAAEQQELVLNADYRLTNKKFGRIRL